MYAAPGASPPTSTTLSGPPLRMPYGASTLVHGAGAWMLAPAIAPVTCAGTRTGVVANLSHAAKPGGMSGGASVAGASAPGVAASPPHAARSTSQYGRTRPVLG